MAPEHRDWTVPAPLRALLWWPLASFVLVLVAPEAAASSIALAGAVLVALGAMASALTRRLRGGTVGTPGGMVTEEARAVDMRSHAA